MPGFRFVEEVVMLSSGPLLGRRLGLLVLSAGVVGVIAGVLGFYAQGGIANAVLVGGGAAGGAVALVNGFLERR